MSFVLLLAFLFSIGSMLGWVLELFYRRYISQHKWVNPGFLSGPCLPIYGCGLVILYLIASLDGRIGIEDPNIRKIVLFVIMAICMTVIEYIAGWISLHYFRVRLWDYSNNWGNISGLICPLYSFFWSVLGALYYFLIHPHILRALEWLSNNLAFSFFVGFFYGIFVIDFVHQTKLVMAIKKFARQKQIVMHYEEIKERIGQYKESRLIKAGFIFRTWMDQPINRFLKETYETTKEIVTDLTGGIREDIQTGIDKMKSKSSGK
ncbi:MAG: putative ABC transporter permease [Clostridiales bacterium]|nr:putative ABC transporter permease [Clostridiales bacterium]